MSDVDVVQSSSLPTPSVEVSRATQPEKNRHNSSQIPPSADPGAVADSDENRNGRADDGSFSPRADSEAETIIQSGRESLSPEKRRKFTGFERSQDHTIKVVPESAATGDISPAPRKRKRDDEGPFPVNDGQRSSSTKSKDEVFPPTKIKKEPVEEPPNAVTQSESSEVRSSSESPRSRKRSSSDSALDGDATDTVSRARADLARNRDRRESSHSTSRSRLSKSKERSTSPSYRSHKRTISGPSNIQQKKKKGAGTLLPGRQRHGSEDRQSVSSSASGSPLPPSQCRRLTSEGAAASPARPVSHKKQRDQNGRTRLARACAAQEYEAAVARHAERPEDLNVADNAGNTPLQIAALEGCVPIVKFLLEAGCEVDTRNIDKDTPLIDAVENGHLEVVKLLLEAGANPRLVNAQGDEPYDLVPSDSEDYEEIRRVLAEARANPRFRRTDNQNARENSSKPSVQSAPSVQSPRESPFRSPPPARRKTTVRREVTRNDLFWTQATPENLREFAAKGDMAGVANILNITQKADPESLIAAAKGGHEDVMSLLLGIGFADPDPDPIDSPHLRPGYNTPMLAAIGRGNLGVIRLLLDQPNFDPTRRVYQDRYYFEIARDRKGENWEEEEELLRSAFEKYQAAKKEQQQESKSPRRSRDESKDGNRQESPRPVSRRSNQDSPSNRHGDSNSKHAKARDTSSRRREKSLVNGGRPKAVRRDDSSDRRSAQTSAHNNEEAPVRRRRLIPGRPPQNRDQPKPSFAFSESSEDEKISVNRPRDSMLKRSRSNDSASDGRAGAGEVQKRRRVLSDESDHDTPNANSNVKESRPASSASASLDVPQVKSETRDHDSEVPVDASDDADAEAKAEEERIAAKKEQAERARLKKEEELRQAAELARAAREKAEEEERRRREAELRRARQAEEERQRRAEQERMRIAKLRRDQEEQEQRRRDALPDRLRIAANLIGANDPRARSHAWLRHFMPVVTAQTKQLDPQCSPEVAEERWVPNFLVAPLLATNDLQLSQYASWEKRQATPTQRLNLWRVTRRILLVDESEAPETFGQVIRKDEETRPKYFDMEHVFWVKVRL